MADIRVMSADRARLLAWVASAQNIAVVAAVAFVVVAFAAAEAMRAKDLHLGEPGPFAKPASLSFVGVPTPAYRQILLYPSVGSRSIGPRNQD